MSLLSAPPPRSEDQSPAQWPGWWSASQVTTQASTLRTSLSGVRCACIVRALSVQFSCRALTVYQSQAFSLLPIVERNE